MFDLLMRRDRDTIKTTPWRVYEERGRVLRGRAKYGMSYIAGNSQPYFSLTVDVERKVDSRWEEDGGGCCHELAVRLFPETAPLVKWHLASQDGTPMYYQENGLFWYRMACGVAPRGPYDRDPLGCFKSTVVWGAVEGDPEEVPLHWSARELSEVLAARLQELRLLFHRDMVAAGVREIPREEYEVPASGKADADA